MYLYIVLIFVLIGQAFGLSNQELVQATKQYLENQLPKNPQIKSQIKVAKIDSRFKLKDCPVGQLTFFFNGNQQVENSRAVGIQCEAQQSPWKIYLPYTLTQRMKVLTPKHPLSRGQKISASDIQWKVMDVRRLSKGYYTDPNAVIGKLMRQPLAMGRPLTPALVQQADLISKGQKVIIFANIGSMKVQMDGRALSAGKMHERIRVKNLSSNKVIDAKIINNQSVRVGI